MRRFIMATAASALVAAGSVAGAAEPGQSVGISDPAVTSTSTPSSLSTAPSASRYPLSAFSAFGTSLALSGHFGEMGWSDPQFEALLDGMREALHGKPIPMDADTQQLAAETARKIAESSGRAVPPASGAVDDQDQSARHLKDRRENLSPSRYPLSAYSAFGTSLALTGHFGELGWSDAQFEALLEGMRAAFHGKPIPMDADTRQLAAETARKVAESSRHAPGAASGAFNDQERLARYFKNMRKYLNLQISDSGLGYNVEPATQNGVRPRPGDTIVITCRATAPDGVTRLPQLSAERIRVKMDGMMPGLREGIQMMTIGTEAVFLIPPSLSFGDGPWPEGVERGSPLVYTVTLNDVIPAGVSR
jgi:FKBP-type peptidyl-prolyl cis-trans isomerase